MKRIAALALAALAVGACAMLQPPEPPPEGELATRVSGTLTALPPAITLPPETQAPPATPEGPSPTATSEPTQAPPTATFTPEPSVTPLPSLAPLATPTLPAGDPRSQLGSPTWRDPFDATNNWPLGEDDFTRAQIEDGQLVLTGLSTTDGWRLTSPEVHDFYIEMTVETESCSSSDHYGLMVRVPDRHEANQGYLFAFTCDGRFSLRAWDGETMTSLVPNTANASILAGSDKTNRMGLMADGDRLVLYANGVQLREVEDDAYNEPGSFGVFVGARQTADFTIRVSEIAYWENP